MITIYIFIMLFMLFYSIFYIGITSSSTIIIVYLFMSSLYLFMLPYSGETNWYVYVTDRKIISSVVLMFTAISIPALAVAIIANKRFVKLKKVHITREHVNSVNVKLLRAFSIILFPIFILYLWHFIRADFTRSWSYADYMSSRDLEFYGLSDIFSNVAQKLIKIFGLYSAISIPMFIYPRIRFLSLSMLLFIFIYILFIHVIMGSKFVGVMLFMAALSFYYKGSGVIRTLIAYILFAAGVWLLFVNFSVRYSRSYGLSNFFQVFLQPDFSDFGSLTRFGHLTLGAADALYWSVEKTVTYTTYDKILSFSPFISLIDGYENVPNESNTLMFWSTRDGDIWAPISGLGQIYHFGFAYFIIFMAVLCLSIYHSEKVRYRYSGVLGFIPTAFIVLGFVWISVYPLRNGFRFIIVGFILSFVISKWKFRRSEKKCKQRNRDISALHVGMGERP